MQDARIMKNCPQCGRPLVKRENGETGEPFLGCSQYPECKFTQPIPTDMLLRMQGVKPLPGFE